MGYVVGILMLPLFYVIGLCGVVVNPNTFDYSLGVASPEENWVLTMRRENARKKFAETYLPKIGDVFEIKTVEACDRSLALLHAYPEDDEVEREERAKINDAQRLMLEEKRAALVWAQTEEGRRETADRPLAKRPSDFAYPISLFVKQVTIREPFKKTAGEYLSTTNRFEFDFLKADWLPPYGTGVTADVVFTFMPREVHGEFKGLSGHMGESYTDTMFVSFPGLGNGYVDMEPYAWRPTFEQAPDSFKLAPTSGYLPVYKRWHYKNKQLQDEHNYNHRNWQCIRIRTRYDRNGNVASAHYGKIRGDYQMWFWQDRQEDTCKFGVEFLYHLNPTPLDRNVFWNEINLCEKPSHWGDWFR